MLYYTLNFFRALIAAQEQKEDDIQGAIDDLEQAIAGNKKYIYCGITCGLSAPCKLSYSLHDFNIDIGKDVAAQVDYSMKNNNCMLCSIIGFNPSHLARKNIVENWNKSFQNVLNDMLAKEETNQIRMLINPILGPEPVTGSTRMKVLYEL